MKSAESFSVILPVHNEEQLLPYTLPGVFRLRPREVVLVLDRCTDRSEVIAQRMQRHHFPATPLSLIRVRELSGWSIHLNYLYHLGVKQAQGPAILLAQADIMLDPACILRHLHLAMKGSLVSFGVSGHPHLNPYNSFITRSLIRIGDFIGGERFFGVLALTKQTYSKIALNPHTPHNFDTYLLVEARRKGIPYHFIPAPNFDLRPRRKASFRFDRILWELGVAKYRVGKSFLRVLAYSLLRMTPSVMAGWLQAKLADKHSSRSG